MVAARIATGLFISVPLWLAAGAAVLTETSLSAHRSWSPSAGGESVRIAAADGVLLFGVWQLRTLSAERRECVVVLHGIGDSHAGAVGFTRTLTDLGYAVLAPDGRAHGQSGGDRVTFGVFEKDDMRRWALWLRKTQSCSKVYGLGESLGASVLIMAASGDTPLYDAVVAECPYADLQSIAGFRVAEIVGGGWLTERLVVRPLVQSAIVYTHLRYGLDLRGADTVEAARQLRVPVLLIHGVDDRRTPVEHSRRILAAARAGTARLWEVPHAGHTQASAADGERFWSEVCRLFRTRRLT